ncbi:specifically androgen-regulated gene protein [Rhinatrema bivittatum]|uniref:specifically androgen-regulated gene protein n=1 Tax=Rhinatrema bivittatum TaxID=194408 RepID=UPI00112A66C3|nr:specifically androgen-regulated gene protein [Rhinatrema bivittatum]XP_029429208.1 specifically androgen-regulated gene protein [Rhinatrema bivittatum]
MPETKSTGMESMMSLGSAGSCDSVVSITSNHSTFSDECYDHLSAEERECLMFLEETIDSLDVEGDSGLSTDESERVDEASHKKMLPKNPYDAFPKSPGQHPEEVKIDVSRPDLLSSVPVPIPSSGFRSLPRNVQAPREEGTLSVPRNVAASCIDVSTVCNGKPSAASERPMEENQRTASLQELLLIPPPEPFRDQKLAKQPSKTKLPEMSTGDPAVSEVDGTAVKEQSERVFGNPEVSVPSQQLSPGPEGVSQQKVQNFPCPQPPQIVQHVEKSLEMQKVVQETPCDSQESLNHLTAKTVDQHFKQGPPIAPKPRKLPPNIILKRSDGSVVTPSAESDPKAKTSSLVRNADALHVKPFVPREQGKARQEALMKLGLKVKPEELSTSPLKSPGFPKPSEAVPMTSTESTTKGLAKKTVQNGTSQNVGLQEQMHRLSTSPEKSLAAPKSREVDPKASTEGLVKAGRTEALIDKRATTGLVPLEKAQLSTSPGQPSGFPTPREVSVLKAGVEGMTRDGKTEVADKRNSSYSEPGVGLRLPEGSLPGVRHFSFKSNTLERSGIGLSGYADSDEQSQKSSGSIFKNAPSNKFSSSLLRNSRPRPASLGTGKDFSNLQNPGQEKAEPERNENRRSFPLQNFSRSSRPGVSVKITPKGASSEEHRREALLKLGLLK